jgi:ATP-binding cassette subfamily B protein
MALNRGVQLKPEHFASVSETDTVLSILRMFRDVGLDGKAFRGRRWRHLIGLSAAFPIMARQKDGHWVIVVNLVEGAQGTGLAILDPQSEGEGPRVQTRSEFLDRWSGELVLCKLGRVVKEEVRKFDLGWFMPDIMRQRSYLRDVAVAAIMSSIIGMATPLLFQILIDKAITHHSYQTLSAVVLIYCVLTLFDGIFSYARQYLMMFVTNKIDARLAARTFKHLLALPLYFFESTTAGLLTRNLQQTESIRHFLTGRLFQTMLDAVSLPMTIVLLALYSGKLTLLVMAFTLAIAAVIGVMIPAFRRQLEHLYAAEGSRQGHLVETIHGMRTVKSLALEPSRMKVWNDTVALGVERRTIVGRMAAVANVLTTGLEKTMQIAILGIGAVDVFDGSLSMGALIAFNMVAGRVSGPLVQMVALINEYQQTALAVKMLGTVMQHPPERDPTRTGLAPQITGKLEFDSVTFRYHGAAAPALDRVSFTVQPGQVIGIVGRSGSGKTTVTRLIQAVQSAQDGAIRLDGIDIRHIDLPHLRRSIGVVLQENFLFRGTIKENIAAAAPHAALGDIIEAARMAGADEFIERLPHSYDTFVEENGANFSGGQRQRVAIARSLLVRPRLLIFDEATSALDPESEAIVQDHLTEIAHGRTLLIVSHRLTSLASADAILVLERGKVLDFAPHAVLLGRCDVYQRLWQQQTKSFQ